jgi:hypothetical protein
MINSREENLLIKYLSNEANTLELDELEEWISDPVNEKVLKRFVNVHYAVTIIMNHSNPGKIRERLLFEIRRDKIALGNRKMRLFFKYAALAIAFIGMGYFFQQLSFGRGNKINIVPKAEAITLELDNGDVQKMSILGTSQIKDRTGDVLGVHIKDKLVYDENKFVGSDQLTFNKLKVPYGKRFDVILSDGTHVFLNSGSTLKYPVSFVNEGPRQVFLSGEAYFEVSQDPQNPFLVGTQELNVRVYGTKFIVSNYASDNDIDVVLVEGSVAIETKKSGANHIEKLKPGFKGTFDKRRNALSTERVDTMVYTAWMDGDLVFRNAPFATIVKQLERQYNVVIINNNKQLNQVSFNATFETEKESLEQIFEYFNEVYDIDYQIYNGKIIIN